MKYRFTLQGPDGPLSFEAEAPAEMDYEPDCPMAKAMVDRALSVARYLAKSLGPAAGQVGATLPKEQR